MSVNAKQIATALQAIEYPVDRSISRELCEQAKKAGLVIVYGISDDIMAFGGAIEDEVGCFGGGTAYLTGQGLVKNECDDDRCPYFSERLAEAVTIEALWCEGGNYSWTYRTEIPHETFEVVEDGLPYCRGIVFALADVRSGQPAARPAINTSQITSLGRDGHVITIDFWQSDLQQAEENAETFADQLAEHMGKDYGR